MLFILWPWYLKACACIAVFVCQAQLLYVMDAPHSPSGFDEDCMLTFYADYTVNAQARFSAQRHVGRDTKNP